MKQEITDEVIEALKQKYVVSSLIFIYDKKVVLKYQLKGIVKGWRRVDKLVDVLKSVGLIYEDDITVQDKKLHKIQLSDLGKRVVDNLMDIHGPKIIQVMYRRGYHDDMLLRLYKLRPKDLRELFRFGYIEEARGLLWELQQMGMVEIEQNPAKRVEDWSIRLTPVGEEIAKKLEEIEELASHAGKTPYQE